MPNPRKPSQLKALQGTLRKDRTNPREPKPSTARPAPPDYLSDRAASKFLQLSEILGAMRVASSDDADALAILASLIAEIEEDTVLLESVGPFYKPSAVSGLIRAHPAVSRLANNRQRVQAMFGEFGLTPAARGKVSASALEEENPFARFV